MHNFLCPTAPVVVTGDSMTAGRVSQQIKKRLKVSLVNPSLLLLVVAAYWD
jgi:hypothetical protein